MSCIISCISHAGGHGSLFSTIPTRPTTLQNQPNPTHTWNRSTSISVLDCDGHRIDNRYTTSNRNYGRSCRHRSFPKVAIARWRTARVIISLFLPNQSQRSMQFSSLGVLNDYALYKSINALTRSMSSEITNDVKVKVIF